MDKLAKLELAGATDGPIKVAWEDAFLDTLHHLCSTPDPPLAEVTSQRPAHRPVLPSMKRGHRTPMGHCCIRFSRHLMSWYRRKSHQLSVQLRCGPRQLSRPLPPAWHWLHPDAVAETCVP